jgi:bifunctional DNA-binding transcriptional regulator/antitoxin component of YhaV-PrlF toxin-antitoxin module
MGKTATFIAEFLKDGHLSIPEKIVKALSLETGKRVKTVIETEKFSKKDFLELFGIWKDKTETEIDIYKEILRERERFGRVEVKL